jgi:subtilisin family serine protease
MVFEGTLPQGDIAASDQAVLRPMARVADHLIARPAPGLSEAEFRKAVIAAGLVPSRQLAPGGPWLVQLPRATIRGVDDAIAALKAGGQVSYAEPDFLVHASDIPAAAVPVDVVNGVLTYPESALDANTARQPDAPVFDPGSMAALAEARLESLPAGARVLTFDPPTFMGGPADYNPSLEEQNFVVSTDGGVYIQSAYSSGYPSNGTYYARSLSSETNFTVKHRESLPFTVLSVDLAEYSTSFASPKTIGFTGYKASGGTVTQSFTTDGVMDGTGPATDFQTFTFNSNFTNLTRIVANTTLFQIDNIAVIVEGQESTPPAPPTPPLIYDVTWDAPKHTVDQVAAVSGPYAPSSINFGTPTVRAQVGTLAGPALELKGCGYQQIRYGIGRNAKAYRLEYDAYLDLPTDFMIYFDLQTNFYTYTLKSNGTMITSAAAISGTYPQRQKIHVASDVDMVAGTIKIYVDAVLRYSGAFPLQYGDIHDIRFHESGSTTGSAGLDNVQIYAYGVDSVPATAPRLIVYPANIAFPPLPIGSKQTWYLTLANSGGQTLNVQSIASSNAQFHVNGTFPVSILPGGTYYATVDFLPQTAGLISGNLTITSNDATQPTLAVPASGTGLGVPQITLTPPSLDVTMLANTTGTQTFTIGNPGSGNLLWNLVLKDGSAQTGTPTDPSLTPDDTLFSALYAMRAPQAGIGGIDAVHAWSVTHASAANVIAIIDTGVDRTHPELQGNLWVNTGEIPGNGIDDDGNGFIDDVNGWDFHNRDNDPADGHGHGTHVAGTIAARGNNTLGVTGVCWNAQIMPLKFLSDAGSGYTSDAVSAVSYATRMGARVSNNSWGGGGYSQALFDAIKAANVAGSLFVAAAGNNNSDNDSGPHYPASYAAANVTAVAATDSSDALAYYSNYGANSVHLAAPGTGILSLRPGGQYAYLSGTSMATPHVTGVAALLLSQNPTLTPIEVKRLLLLGVDSLASLSASVASQGRLNAYHALKATVPQWLQPQVTSGTVGAGGSMLIPLSVKTNSLTTGSYLQTIAIRSNDPAHPLVDLPVVLRIVPADDYGKWAVNQFGNDSMLANSAESTLWSATADPDRDNLSNLLEFITGNNPALADAGTAPAMVNVAGESLFEFRVRDTLIGATYQVEWTPSLDPADWRTTGLETAEDTTIGMPPGLHRLRIRLTDPHSTAYFRLSGRQAP